VAVVALPRPRVLRPSVDDWVGWLAAHREIAWMLALVGVAALAHAWNMFEFPYYESDEGTYVAQAWAVVHLGQLAPYTYWYDHPPLGWIQLGLLSELTGGFNALGNTVATGRVFMLLYQVGSALLLYRAARGAGRSTVAASIAVLAFSFSAYGLYFHRRVLLDNIAAFWLLAALVPLLAQRVTLNRIWISAAALGIGLLSKEIDVIVVPAMVFLVVCRADRSQRWIAGVGWTAVVATLGSLWVLLAVLKGELFPPGGFLSGSGDHVSLIGTLQSQAARDADGGLLQAGSGFWWRAIEWAQADPLLVVVGTLAAILAASRIKRDPVQGSMALMVISLWLFLGRGGATLPFYLVPLLPLLALQVAWLVDIVTSFVQPAERWSETVRLFRRVGVWAAAIGLVTTCTMAGYENRPLLFADNPAQVWTSRPAVAQRRAITWIRNTLPVESGIVTDMYAWLDLQAPATPPRFELAHWTWKVGRDPEIQDGVFGNDWHRIDYLVVTPQVFADASSLPLVQAALDHSDIVASFGDGDWPVIIERTRVPHVVPIADDTLLARQWTEWTSSFLQAGRVTAPASNGPLADIETMGLLQAAYMDDQATFDRMWAWTKANLIEPTGLLSAGPGVSATAGPGTQADAAEALAFAARRWNDGAYQGDALALMQAIWDHETQVIGGTRLAVAGTRPIDRAGRLLVDLSGLAPNAYRIFAAADPRHDWASVIEGTYRLLGQLSTSVAFGGAAGVTPHWATIDPDSGRPAPIQSVTGHENLFDAQASRLVWRVGLDWLWSRDPRALAELQALSMPRRELAQKSWLGRAYHLDGQPVDGSNTVATYATALPSVLFGGASELAASTFTKDVLAPVVGSQAPDPNDAIGRSWAWFATALMDGSLVDLSRGPGVIDWSTVPGPNPAPTTAGQVSARSAVPPR
jgi:endo-1,4-beta-D-glucanase Y